MGCLNSKESKKNKTLSKQKQGRYPFKILLLGPTNSGKSTFLKQMLFLYKEEGLPKEKIQECIPYLRMNTLDTMKLLISSCAKWDLEFSDTEKTEVEKVISAESLTPEVARSIVVLWHSKVVETALQQRHRMQLAGPTEYYMEHAERFADEDFVPTVDDFLRVHIRTTSINEINLEVPTIFDFQMVEVGGHRSERKKWQTCCNNLSVVIYFTSLDEYDMLEEDNVTNRMEESIKLFKNLSGQPGICEIPMILFLNKYDLFEQRIKQRPLSLCFKDFEDYAKKYSHKTELECSRDYILDRFAEVFNGTRFHYKITCSLDFNNCDKVAFPAVRGITLSTKFHLCPC